MYETLDEATGTITLLLKGPSGSGKTYKAAQFPSPVFFNFDNNLSGLRGLPTETKKGIRIVNPRLNDKGEYLSSMQVWDNFVKQLEKVCLDATTRTIVIDSLSSLSNVLMDMIIKSSSPGAKVELQHWGSFQRYLKWLGEELLNNKSRNFNVIVIAHEQLEKDELTQQVIYSLNIGSSLRTSFDMFFTDCWRCYTKQAAVTPASPKGVEYRVRVLPANQFNAKCSLTDLPADFIWEQEKTKILNQIK